MTVVKCALEIIVGLMNWFYLLDAQRPDQWVKSPCLCCLLSKSSVSVVCDKNSCKQTQKNHFVFWGVSIPP